MIKKEIVSLQSELYLKCASIYSNPSLTAKAVVLYFHGGGLLYGQRDDLPDFHLNELCNAGFILVSFDYPLAPAAKIGQILDDVKSSICLYSEQPSTFSPDSLPYFIWGRSAGAYLCLLASSHTFENPPLGIISYYGYGFLTDHWYNEPSSYYCRLPQVSKDCIPTDPEIKAIGELDTCYSLYIYARQTGKWVEQFFQEREKFFYKDFSLRNSLDFSLKQAVFLAHSTKDTDVPYKEFQALKHLLTRSETYLVSDEVHDFDRYTDTRSAQELLAKTIQFMDKALES